jgi:capsular polysaccharide transport system permease protein
MPTRLALPPFSFKSLITHPLFVIMANVLPMVVLIGGSWVYFTTQVPDRFQTESAFIIKGSKTADQGSGKGVSALLGAANGQIQDAFVVKRYIESPEMLAKLNAEFNLLATFQRNNIDWQWHLSPKSSSNEVMRYYRQMVKVHLDETSGLLILTVEDFDKKQSVALARAILRNAETFLNQLSHQVATNQLGFGDEQLAKSSQKLAEAQSNLQAFQAKHALVSLNEELGLKTNIIATLEADLAQKDIELETASSYLSDDAFKVISLRQQRQNIQAKLDEYRQGLSGQSQNPNDPKLVALQKDYDKLKLDVQFWTDNYQANLKTLEATKLEAVQKLKFLLLVSEPFEPLRSEVPKRGYLVLTVLLGGGLLLGIFRLMLFTVWDHQER